MNKKVVPVPIVTEVKSKRNHNATESLKRTLNFINFLDRIIGWSLSYDWKSNPRHWFTCSVNLFSWSQFLYTQIRCVVNGEYSRVFQVFGLYGMTVSYSLKIVMFIRNHKQLTALHNFTYKITRHADGKSVAEVLDKQQRNNLKLCKVITILAILSVSIYGFNSTSEFIFAGKLVPLLPTDMLFLDQTKISHFLIANSIMILMGLWTCVVILVVVLHFIMLILNCSIQVDLIEDDIRQLDELWSNPEISTVRDRQMFLKNICQKCQDKDSYMDEVKRIFDQPLYWYFCVAYVSQIVCMYEIEMENWIPGIGIVLGAFLEMLMYCMVGTKSAVVNERLCYVLTQSKWYTYDIYSQKIFLNLLNSCMNAKELWIGPFAPLSVITGIQVVKSIYSYYTFLAEVA